MNHGVTNAEEILNLSSGMYPIAWNPEETNKPGHSRKVALIDFHHQSIYAGNTVSGSMTVKSVSYTAKTPLKIIWQNETESWQFTSVKDHQGLMKQFINLYGNRSKKVRAMDTCFKHTWTIESQAFNFSSMDIRESRSLC